MMLCAFPERLDRSFDRLVTLLEQSDAIQIVDLPVTPCDPILQKSGGTGNASSVVTISLAYNFLLWSRLGDEMEYSASFLFSNTTYSFTSCLSILPSILLGTIFSSSSLLLALPPHQPPRHNNHAHGTHQQPNTRRITNPILRSES